MITKVLVVNLLIMLLYSDVNMSYGLEDRKEYLEYKKWMKEHYSSLGCIVHPYYVREFKKEKVNDK